MCLCLDGEGIFWMWLTQGKKEIQIEFFRELEDHKSGDEFSVTFNRFYSKFLKRRGLT